jgi:hypothetical protein
MGALFTHQFNLQASGSLIVTETSLALYDRVRRELLARLVLAAAAKLEGGAEGQGGQAGQTEKAPAKGSRDTLQQCSPLEELALHCTAAA